LVMPQSGRYSIPGSNCIRTNTWRGEARRNGLNSGRTRVARFLVVELTRTYQKGGKYYKLAKIYLNRHKLNTKEPEIKIYTYNMPTNRINRFTRPYKIVPQLWVFGIPSGNLGVHQHNGSAATWKLSQIKTSEAGT
jgi:hypothetical protein